jgi:hypothetical protein
MIDNMLLVACHGHKVMFEDRVPQSSILALRNVALKNARENEANFCHLWKKYLVRSGDKKESPEVTKELFDRVNGVMGDDDDDDDDDGSGSAGAGAAPAGEGAAPAEGAASPLRGSRYF